MLYLSPTHSYLLLIALSISRCTKRGRGLLHSSVCIFHCVTHTPKATLGRAAPPATGPHRRPARPARWRQCGGPPAALVKPIWSSALLWHQSDAITRGCNSLLHVLFSGHQLTLVVTPRAGPSAGPTPSPPSRAHPRPLSLSFGASLSVSPP